ncbi:MULTISPECIES: DUF86 domain-containing protein [unclassified Bacillus (in: firmicutes)]|uniref:DUF86 domain-containing protein n=1 Tax=unclassified Bacillus (in: firmicutes) TaxID=185979 RepID=UPI0008EC66C6|nr:MULTISPECIES: DUF86 domain-containing protein [unclassified Bacillus (in: firmicutes)]SFB12647.1 Uncharacterized conserved protein YutE, UPF0331/DUF86 family [Bacillus sp. UNCCL13]SFQ90232.1 Uncharacterized conserved protein YutE, UPF0331/DUF86 family [Bacillus sp. cl95]
MYFVDRDKIEETLVYLDRQLELFLSQKDWRSPIEIAALERLTHTMLEAVLDVGNSIIDGFIMRDPGSYEDIVDILMDEKVITSSMGESLKLLVQTRKNLVQSYLDIDHSSLVNLFQSHSSALSEFPTAVRNYLVNELGPVTAFKN